MCHVLMCCFLNMLCFVLQISMYSRRRGLKEVSNVDEQVLSDLDQSGVTKKFIDDKIGL